MRKARKQQSRASKSKSGHAGRMWVGVALLVILLIGLGLRMRQLGDESPWFDEIITIRHLDAPSLPAFLEDVRDFNEPVAPGYLALEYFCAHTLGCSWYGLRIVSVLLGMATIVALFDLTAVLFGPLAGLLAALALALNVTHIYYSQEIRMYALSGLLAVLSVRSFIAFLDKGKTSTQITNSILNLLLVWTHPISLILPCVEAMHLLWFKRRPWREAIPWLLLQVMVGVSIVLWSRTRDPVHLAELMRDVHTPTILGFKIGVPSVQSFCMFMMGSYIQVRLKRLALVIPLVAVLLFLWLAVRNKRVSLSTPLRNSFETAALLLAWLLVPIVGVFALSQVWTPCFVERYFLFSTFPFYIILGALVTFVRPPVQKGLSIACVLIVMSLSVLLLPEAPLRRPFSQLAAQVRTYAKPADEVVLRPFGMLNFEFQYHLARKDLVIETAMADEKMRERINSGLARGADVWLVGVAEPTLPTLVQELGYKGASNTWGGMTPLQLVLVPKRVN